MAAVVTVPTNKLPKIQPPKLTYEDFDYNELLVYGGIDTFVTYELFKELFPKVAEQPTYLVPASGGRISRMAAPSVLQEHLQVKQNALMFMIELKVNGLLYDQELHAVYEEDMKARLASLQGRIFTAVGEEFNLDSAQECERILYTKMGLTTTILTKGGGLSTSGDALKELFKTYKLGWLKDMAEYGDISGIYGNFIKDYVSKYVKKDGRLHPNYNLHGTSSHRISGDRPNLLNIPVPKHGYNIRRLYKVPEGHAFLTFDFSSCEVKVLAALCKDKKMLESILQGLDFHSYTAGLMYNVPYEELVEAVDNEDHPNHKLYKGYRKNAKSVTFGLLYGSSVGGVAMNIGCSNEDAQKIIDAYFNVYPDIKKFIDDAHDKAKLNYWVFSEFKQRKMEFGLMPMYERSAVYNASLRNAQNNLIQGPASTLGLVAFAKFSEEVQRIGGRVVCTVYDSLELEIPIEHLAEAIEIGYQCLDDFPLQKFDWLDFKIGCDCEVGYNWGQLRKATRGVSQIECERLLELSTHEH